MFKVYSLILVGYMLMFVSQNSVAAFIYDEDLDGDIDTASIPTFNFLLGTNLITGNASYDTVTTPFSSDFDYFNFTTPDNTYIKNVMFSFSVISNEGNPTFQTEVNLKEISHSFDSAHPTVVDIASGDGVQYIALSHLPNVNLYQWKEAYQSFDFHNERVSWDYNISFDIATVPLPTSVLLFLSGLISLLSISPLRKNYNK